MPPEHLIQEAYAQLSTAVASVVGYRDGYLAGLDRAYQANVDEIVRQTEAAVQNSWLTIRDAVTRAPWCLAGWRDAVWDAYTPPGADAPAFELRVGDVVLPGAPAGFGPVPAVAGFVGHGNIMLISDSADMPAARTLLEALTLRLMVSTRPGSVRLALADAFGQGAHLSGFLRLPPELRVGTGIAADVHQVEDLLTVLTEHAVEVSQTRLGNLHDSIESYNAVTTGLGVPYTVVVLSDFPAGITERSAQMLANLARNGRRAGIYLIASITNGVKLPRDFSLQQLTAGSTTLRVSVGANVTWDDPELARYAVAPDSTPEPTRVNEWLRAVGDAAAGATTSVAFDRIAIPAHRRWAASTRDGFEVQIGVDSRGEPQTVHMGSGAVHHGLIGGAVRMGKTNLLHVMLIQLALTYPPEELEFYLVDLKEVEFELYLNGRLPHARAICSRTDREYVLSLLRRFRDEIERRSKLFREASRRDMSNYSDLSSYRSQTGAVLPRALIVFDEYQFIFQDGDRLSDQARVLLEDVARRGAAFGLHIVLASQSPQGRFTHDLRQVYEQMALRIALGCRTPEVSQAILGDGNSQATKLTQPGQAIVDDGGSARGESVMRVAMLPDAERMQWVHTIRGLANDRQYPPPATFDPDALARLEANPEWAGLAAGGPQPEQPTVTAWLGEPIAIKPATAAVFERYPRSGLLVAGDEDGGRRLLLASMLSVAVHRSPEQARFVVFDFARPSSRFKDFSERVRREMPHRVDVVGERDAQEAIVAVDAEVTRRLAAAASTEEIYVVVSGLHNWYDVLAERGYGEANPAGDALLRVLKEGPEMGVYGVVWVDGYASAERALRRQTTNLFGQRVALYLDESESSSLIGIPAASRLGENRALLWSAAAVDDRVEKFKPYSAESLAHCLGLLARQPGEETTQ